MKIERVYVATHKADIRMTRICVASIRRWYPDIPIYLIKDMTTGDFSTGELERVYDVRLFDLPPRSYGYGFSKLEPLFKPDPGRFLLLDSDIVLLGRVIERLEAVPGDFVVDEETQPLEYLAGLYFDLDKLALFDPKFAYPGFTFNSGQWVGRGGLLTREDFADVVDYSEKMPKVKPIGVFNPSDQGVINYVLMRKASAGALKIGRVQFMKYGEEATRELDLRLMGDKSPYPYILHWAGMKKPFLRKMLRPDILDHFEHLYYSRLALGPVKRRMRAVGGITALYSGKIVRRARRVLRNVKASIASPFQTDISSKMVDQ